MRGYGQSDKPCGLREYTLDVLLDDVNQLITELGMSDLSLHCLSHELSSELTSDRRGACRAICTALFWTRWSF